MHHRRSAVPAVLFVAVSTLVGAPSAPKAETPTESLDRAPLDQVVVRKSVDGIATELREGYVFPDLGEKAADAIQSDLEANVYAKVTDPVEFARHVTERLRAITKDSHIRVIYGSPFANRPKPSEPRGAGFEVKRLDGNIGYIHLESFVPPKDFNPAADETMRNLADTTALIIDMRDNGGGHPASVAYLISFFLDPSRRVHINDLIWRNRGTARFRT